MIGRLRTIVLATLVCVSCACACASFAAPVQKAARPVTKPRARTATSAAAPAPAPAPAPIDSARVAWTEARQLTDAGQHERALQVIGEALRAYPGNSDLLWLEAAIHGYMGNHVEAVAHYERLLAAHPELARDVRMDLANARLDAGDPAGAIRDYDLRIAEEPSDRDARVRRALALSYADRLRESLSAYEQLQSEDPADLDLMMERARVLGWMGRHDDAIALYGAVLAREPDRTGAAYGIARNQNWAGYHRRAAASYDSLRTAGQTDPELDKGLAFALYGSGRPAAAKVALERYRMRVPQDPEAEELADRIALERSAGFALGYARTDDSDLLRVESRTVDVRLPLPGEAALLLNWRRDSMRDPLGTFDPYQFGAGLERTWGNLWTARGYLYYWKRDAEANGIGLGEGTLTWRPTEPVRLDLGYAKETIATRLAVERGIIARTWAAGIDWSISERFMLHGGARLRDFSDGNHATQLEALARVRLHAERRWRAHFTANLQQLRSDQDLDNGYYDPERYIEGGPGLELEWEPTRIWAFTAGARTGWQQEQGADTEPYSNLDASVELTLGNVGLVRLEGARGNSNLSSASGYEQKRWAISFARSFR